MSEAGGSRRITFDHVTKVYSGSAQAAVDDCSLVVEEGELVVFLGPSGCGKTTLLKTVNRLIEPTAGRVLIGDTDVKEIEPTLLRRRMGYVIQNVGLFPHMTVAQNVAVVPRLLRWPEKRIGSRIAELLDLVSLPADRFAHRYPAQLSGGQQQRIGVARALAGDPDVILMDEPFGSIDAISRSRLQDELVELQRSLKKTILFVTHDVDEALRIADRIVVLRAGKVVQFDAPVAILQAPADGFVAELVGADDIVRQLGVVRVDKAMRPLDGGATAPPLAGGASDAGAGGEVPQVDRADSLGRALSVLLATEADELLVTERGAYVGRLTLADIRRAAGRTRAVAPAKQ